MVQKKKNEEREGKLGILIHYRLSLWVWSSGWTWVSVWFGVITFRHLVSRCCCLVSSCFVFYSRKTRSEWFWFTFIYVYLLVYSCVHFTSTKEGEWGREISASYVTPLSRIIHDKTHFSPCKYTATSPSPCTTATIPHLPFIPNPPPNISPKFNPPKQKT